jgi:predicted ATP-dependent protease
MQQNMVNSFIWRELLMIKKGSKTVSGWKVGQVKEICYRSLGDGHLAKPSQVTAEIEAGKAGVIDIDRESWPGSTIQDRHIRILSDYLKANFVSCQRVGIRTRIFFEQSCGSMPVDKASSAELYALLSRIAKVPIRQDIAVTGLVNRKGEIQVSSGLHYKIEAVFDICRTEDSTGFQGVLIPQAAVSDMMLRRDVIQAIENHFFDLIPVRTADEGVQILSGMEAGEKDASGKYPAGTVNYLVDRRLQQLAV